MQYLLDTHALLWIANNSAKLSDSAKDIYRDADNEIFLSYASIWEMVIKVNAEKLVLDYPIDEFVRTHVRSNNVRLLELNINHLVCLEKLPLLHRDPFDRMIIAQAITKNMTVVGCDKTFDQYQVKRIW